MTCQPLSVGFPEVTDCGGLAFSWRGHLGEATMGGSDADSESYAPPWSRAPYAMYPAAESSIFWKAADAGLSPSEVTGGQSPVWGLGDCQDSNTHLTLQPSWGLGAFFPGNLFHCSFIPENTQSLESFSAQNP